jgi:hypothetical protein
LALSNTFTATAQASYSQSDVEALIADIDSDPANYEAVNKFGNALHGQVPFPAALFKAAEKEMLRRYNEIHIPQAVSRAYAADYEGRKEDAAEAHLHASDMQRMKEHFIDQATRVAEMVKQSQADWRKLLAQQAAGAEQELRELARQRAQQAAEAEQQQLRAVVEHKQRVTAVTVQIGTLNQPVTAPKVAKFKPRVAIPSR